MNTAELAAGITTRTSTSKTGAYAAVSAVFSTIVDALAGNQTVTITGFGNFSTKSRQARLRRNARTGEPIIVPAAKTPSFHASKTPPAAFK